MFVLYIIFIVLFAIVGFVALILGLGEGEAKPIAVGLLYYSGNGIHSPPDSLLRTRNSGWSQAQAGSKKV